MYFIQLCFICRLSDSSMSEDAGIKPRTVATSRHWLSDALATQQDLIHNTMNIDNNSSSLSRLAARILPLNLWVLIINTHIVLLQKYRAWCSLSQRAFIAGHWLWDVHWDALPLLHRHVLCPGGGNMLRQGTVTSKKKSNWQFSVMLHIAISWEHPNLSAQAAHHRHRGSRRGRHIRDCDQPTWGSHKKLHSWVRRLCSISNVEHSTLGIRLCSLSNVEHSSLLPLKCWAFVFAPSQLLNILLRFRVVLRER